MRRLLLTLVLLLVLAAPAQAARRDRCLLDGASGEQCWVWTGRVAQVYDGDTLGVRISGVGFKRVRVTGINAMEQSVYSSNPSKRRGDCHALEATRRLEALVRRSHGRVRLAAQDPDSRSGFRLRRSVAVRSAGHWRDVGKVLLREGHAIWLPGHVENAWNEEYARVSQEAAQRHVRLWDPSYCGVGPDDDVPLRLLVNWDADGQDGADLNGEWAQITNRDAGRDIAIGGWYFRDSALRRYRFPSWAIIPAGETVKLYVGQGPDEPGEFYWGLSAPAFENDSYDTRGMGDGGYLFDPQGDLRASMVYPCRVACADPLQGAFEIDAHYKSPEEVRLRNVTGVPLDLDGYRLDSFPDGYVFGPGTVVQPNETLRMIVNGDPADDSRLVKHWGKRGEILANRGDKVTLRTLTDIVLACQAWGDLSC
jgi:endonuclease YncB( thermonuclease family)